MREQSSYCCLTPALRRGGSEAGPVALERVVSRRCRVHLAASASFAALSPKEPSSRYRVHVRAAAYQTDQLRPASVNIRPFQDPAQACGPERGTTLHSAVVSTRLLAVSCGREHTGHSLIPVGSTVPHTNIS